MDTRSFTRSPRAAATWLVLASLSIACGSSERPGTCPPCPSAAPCSSALSPVIVSSALPLDLPKAAGGDDQKLVLQVDVQANGEVHAEGKKLRDLDALLAVAKVEVAANPEIRATIRADSNVTHGRVVAILDVLKQAGIMKIAFGVAPVEPAAPRP
jgi:biopolymer transport protein ExbD